MYPTVEVSHLSKRFGATQAVDDVSFSLETGRSIGLVGESGCGKTTIGMALMGLLPKNARIVSGRILFNNENILDLSEEALRRMRWRRISMPCAAA